MRLVNLMLLAVLALGLSGSALAAQQTREIELAEWTAPRSGDAVVLHVAANAANGDESPFGDLIHTLERTSAGSTTP